MLEVGRLILQALTSQVTEDSIVIAKWTVIKVSVRLPLIRKTQFTAGTRLF